MGLHMSGRVLDRLRRGFGGTGGLMGRSQVKSTLIGVASVYKTCQGSVDPHTHRLHSSSFLGFILRIL